MCRFCQLRSWIFGLCTESSGQSRRLLQIKSLREKKIALSRKRIHIVRPCSEMVPAINADRSARGELQIPLDAAGRGPRKERTGGKIASRSARNDKGFSFVARVGRGG